MLALCVGTLSSVGAAPAQNPAGEGPGIAIGSASEANNGTGIAIGSNTKAKGSNATAIGAGSEANGNNATALGFENKVNNIGSAAVGYKNKVNAQNAYAFGYENAVSRNNSFAIGYQNKVTTKTSNTKAYAFGNENAIVGDDSVAIGFSNKTGGTTSFGAGNNTIIGSTSSNAVAIGNGAKVGATAATNATVDATTGVVTGPTFTGENIASNSVAIGTNASVQAQEAVALGYGAIINKFEAATDTKSSKGGYRGVAIGKGATVSEETGIALGADSLANRAGYSADVVDKADATKVLTKGNPGSSGWDPITNKQSTIENPTWRANRGALSIGNGNSITRQITSVAAGTSDTDAVNVAQLKSAVSNVYMHVNGTDIAAASVQGNNVGTLKETAGAAAKRAVAIGRDAKVQPSADYGAALGSNTNVTAIQGVALGANSQATRSGYIAEQKDKDGKVTVAGNPGSPGYDFTTGANSITTNNIWRANAGAVAIGNGNVTRQITSVAAGTSDTDAVNVAQLKSAVSNVYMHVNGTDTAAASVQGNNVGTLKETAGAAAKRAVAIGRDAKVQPSADYGAALGPNTDVTVAQGVALGNNSKAERAAGSFGYDISTNAASTVDNRIWRANAGAVSVGTAINVTRQITSVAAGTSDTDAVNIAQLKKVSDAIKNNMQYISIKSTDEGNKNRDGARGINSIAIGPTAGADAYSTIGIGDNARVASNVQITGGIAIGKNSYVLNGGGAQEQLFTFDSSNWRFDPEETYSGSRYKVVDQSRVSAGIAIGTNAHARTGSLHIGSNTYFGKMGGIDVTPKLNEESNIMNMTTVGSNSYNKGMFSTMFGIYNIATGNFDGGSGSNYSYGAQNLGATTVGSFNSIRTKGSRYSGTANSIVGLANITENANGALIFGAGNKISNSIINISGLNINGAASVDAMADSMRSTIKSSKGGGAVLAIGGGNTANYVRSTSIIGVNNDVLGNSGNTSEYNFISGFKNAAEIVDNVTLAGINNTVKNSSKVVSFGNENAVSNTEGTILIGDNRTVVDADNSIILGAANNTGNSTLRAAAATTLTTTAKNVIVMGYNANAEKDDSVALGSNSVASIDKGKFGYDPTSTSDDKLSTTDSATWKSTLGSVSVGVLGDDGVATQSRQITGVAAGTNDTDAVNVAQLKQIGNAAASHYYSVNDAKSNPEFQEVLRQLGNYNNDGAQGILTMAAGLGSSVKVQERIGFDPSLQAWAANTFGLLNTIDANSNFEADGIVNSAIGSANTIKKSNTTMVMGAGNIVTNSFEIIDLDKLDGGAILDPNNPNAEEIAGGLSKGIKGVGGQVTVIGTSNTVDYGKLSQIVGSGNAITGTDEKLSGYNVITGNDTTITNSKHVTSIGSNNEVEDSEGNIIVGDYRILSKGNHNIIIGSSDESNKLTTDKSNVVIAGYQANAIVDDSVALGSNSVASIDKGKFGYDPTSTADDKLSTTDSATWKSTLGSVSVGVLGNDGVAIQSRQITGVAAGTNATDAVNVAQLKAVAKAVTDTAASAHTAITLNGQVVSSKNPIVTDNNLTLGVVIDDNGKAIYDIKMNPDLVIGTPVKEGEEGEEDTPVKPGKITIIGTPSQDGQQGRDTSATIVVKEGKAGVNGTDGVDGITRIVYTDPTENGGGEYQVATMDDGLKFAGDDAKPIPKKLNEQLDIKGGANDFTENNIAVVADVDSEDNATGLHVKLAKNIFLDDGSMKFKESAKDDEGNSLVKGEDNNWYTSTDGYKYDEETKEYKNDVGEVLKPVEKPKVESVKLDSNGLDNGGNRITNVAEAKDDSDAVNWGQVKDKIDVAKGEISLKFTGDNTDVSVERGNKDTLKIYGGAEESDFVDANNIGVKGNTADNSLRIMLAKNLNLSDDGTIKFGDNTNALNLSSNQIKFGDTILQNGGLTIGDTIKFTNNGINLGDKKVTYTGSGTIGEKSKDIVNGGTIYEYVKSQFETGGIEIAADDGIKVTRDGSKFTIGLKLKGVDTPTDTTKVETDDSTPSNPNNGTGGNTPTTPSTGTDTGNTGNNSSGTDTGNDSSTPGSESKDVNISVETKPITIGGDSGTATATPGSQFNVVGDDTNITTVASIVESDGVKNPQVQVKLNTELKGLSSVTTKELTVTEKANIGNVSIAGDTITVGKGDSQTVINNNTVNTGSVTTGNTVVDNSGLNINDSDETKKISIQKDNIYMGGNQIHGVGDAQATTDAVNKGQLDNAVNTITNGMGQMSNRISKLDRRVDRVGAGAAALAALHPLEFSPEAKWEVSAGVGNYKGANAVAIGAFYRPNGDTMFSIGTSYGGGENMVNAGVTLRVGDGETQNYPARKVMAQEITTLKGVVAEQNAKIEAQSVQLEEQNQKIEQLLQAVAALQK
ncbi:YadA-like family protein [Veillonella sp. R32]|uniref:YadA-like family protein n=1 Tax=Veillonella sp. R32 TaxID=2021312 RepID=UPI001EE3B491|nr:YadA-like family protein [Veillonella sp. R32]